MHIKRGHLIAAGLLSILCGQGVHAGDPPTGPAEGWHELNPAEPRYPQLNGRFEPARLPDEVLPGASLFIPVSAASTQPSADARAHDPMPDEQVLRGLVAELGSENPKTRTQAAAILRKTGKDALPALREGVKDADAQVRASSQGLIERIEHPEKYEPKPSANQGYAFDRGDRVRIMRVAPLRLQAGVNLMRIEHVGRRDIEVTEPGRRVQIHEDARGIRVMIVGEKPELFHAANADELKRTAPEAFKVYEQYAR